jgi:hypothetical protein
MSKFRTYTKAQLLLVLNEKCLDALAQFPPPEAFDIKMNMRAMKVFAPDVGVPSIRVGYTMRKKSRTPKDVLWLEEHTMHCNCGEHFARDELRNDYLCLYYTTDDDARVNGYIKNASVFLGNDTFEKLSKSGIVTGYSATIKALFRFVLVHCDKATEYEEFESTKRKDLGLGPLIRGLKKLAKRNSQDTEVDEQDGADANALEVSGPVENDKKRTFHESEDEADTLTANKKARTD